MLSSHLPALKSWSAHVDPSKTERWAHFNRSLDLYLESPNYRNLRTISDLVADRLKTDNPEELRLILGKLESSMGGLVESDPQFHFLMLSKILFEAAIKAFPEPPVNPEHLLWISQYVRSPSARAVLLQLKVVSKIGFQDLESKTGLSTAGLME